MAAAGRRAAAGTGDPGAPGGGPDGAGDPAFLGCHPGAGQPLLWLERGGTAGAAAGTAVAPGSADPLAARRIPRRSPRSPKRWPQWRMRNCAPHWRGWGLDQAKLSLPRALAAATRHCHNYRFKLAKACFSHFIRRERANREQTLIITRRAFTAALSLTGLSLLAGFSPLRLISRRDGARRRRRRQAAIAARHGAWPGQRLGDHHRIRVDDLPALRGVHRKSVPEDQVGIHRQRQDPFRVPRIPARHQGGRRIDAGALHRQGRRRRNTLPSSTSCSSSRPTG